MWHLFLLNLLGHVISSTVLISTSAQLFNGTGLGELAAVNINESFPKIELDVLPTTNQTVDDSSMIPKEFSTRFHQDSTRAIGETSTYMTALLAMIAISAENFVAYFAGGGFSFKNYADVRINIWSANSPTDPSQARHAIYGLQVAIYSISKMDAWYETSITLYWSRAGTKFPVGYIKIAQGNDGSNFTLGLANTTQGSGTQPYLTRLFNSTDLLEQDIDTFENARITISPTFSGDILTLQEIFLTLMPAVTIIAQHAATQHVEPFNIRDITIDTEFEYQGVVPPRTNEPYFQYGYAAVALRILPRAIFQAGKLEDVEFTVNVDGIPVGTGFLKIAEDSSASLLRTS